MSSRLFAGAAALALFTSIACGGGRGGDAPDRIVPRTGPADVGVAAARTGWMYPAALRIGSGFDTLRQDARGPCIQDTTLHGIENTPPRVRRLAHPFTQAEAAGLLAASDPVQRARWQVEGHLPMEVEAFAGDPRAVTLLYGAEVRTGSASLVHDAVTLTSTAPAPGTGEFTMLCGDEVAVRQELGAQAFLLYRFWFRDDAARSTFDRLVGTDVPLWELRARLAVADRELGAAYGGKVFQIWHGLSGHSTVTIGEGKVRDLVQLPANLDVADAFVEFVTTDGPDGLRAQAARSSTALEVTFRPWADVLTLHASVPAPRVTPAEVLAARDALAARLDERLRVRDRIRVRQDLGALLYAEQDAVDADLGALRWALDACDDLPSPNDAIAVMRCTAAATAESLAAAGYTGKPALADL